jgi:5'-3' exonuclease
LTVARVRNQPVDLDAVTTLEADDALASAAQLASHDDRVEKICIWTPDKDLAQCVRADDIVQVDRRSGTVRNADGVRSKFGVDPEQIPDYLALVGDAADGYPGMKGIGAKGAASLLGRYRTIEGFPPEVLGEHLSLALLFKQLATLRIDAKLFSNVDELKWQGPTPEFAATCERLGSPALLARAQRTFTLRAVSTVPKRTGWPIRD